MRIIRKTIDIQELNRQAKLYIGLPKDYDTSEKHYPVLYMHDGHNVFYKEDAYANATWQLKEAYDTHEDLPKIIVVALECAEGLERLNEYGPYPFTFEMADTETIPGGSGDRYLTYLTQTLKPEIDAKYRTLKDALNTGIMGSSMGGVISLYAAMKYSDYFGRAAAVSSAFFVSLEPILNEIEKADFSALKKLYLDTGDEEVAGGSPEDYMMTNLRVYESLREKIGQDRLTFQVIAGGKHHENDWAQRLPDILRFLFT